MQFKCILAFGLLPKWTQESELNVQMMLKRIIYISAAQEQAGIEDGWMDYCYFFFGRDRKGGKRLLFIF